jgi:hypothetical protein
MHADKLHVITAISNPIRWKSRTALYREFEKHMLASGVRLHTIECAYGELPFELECEADGVNHIKVRAKTHVWIKENLLNLAIQRLPEDWKYVAWIDADITLRRPDWARATLHALQQYDFVQPWSDAYDLGPQGQHLAAHRSFCRVWVDEPDTIGAKGTGYTYPHPGYAWAATRRALEETGGLLEAAILGSGDYHMAYGLIGRGDKIIPKGVHSNYAAELSRWCNRAHQHVQGNIGYVAGTIEHGWHGPKVARAYIQRGQILVRNQFDPHHDIKRNTHGVMELACNKPKLRREIERYFRQRNEDSNAL